MLSANARYVTDFISAERIIPQRYPNPLSLRRHVEQCTIHGLKNTGPFRSVRMSSETAFKPNFKLVKNQVLLALFGTLNYHMTLMLAAHLIRRKQPNPNKLSAGNILTFSQGCNIGWYSPALPVINSVPSTLIDGPISHDMAGWIGSFLAIGAIFGNLIFGFLANWIGYRRSLLLSAIPIFVSR